MFSPYDIYVYDLENFFYFSTVIARIIFCEIMSGGKIVYPGEDG